MIGLQVFYVVLSLVYLYEGNWRKCQYWIGAFLITNAVLMMK